MEQFEAGGMAVEMTAEGLLRMRFSQGCHPTREDALALLRWLDVQLPLPAPIRVCVDARHSEGLSLLARLEFTDWIRRNASRYRAALVDVPPTMMATAHLVQAAAPGMIRMVPNDALGVAWLSPKPDAARPAEASAARLRA